MMDTKFKIGDIVKSSRDTGSGEHIYYLIDGLKQIDYSGTWHHHYQILNLLTGHRTCIEISYLDEYYTIVA